MITAVRRIAAAALSLAALFAVLPARARDEPVEEAPPPGYRSKWAVVIGINYTGSDAVKQGSLRPLKTAEADAIAFANVLRDRYGFDVKTMIGPEATCAAIKKQVVDYLGDDERVKEPDCALVYFAGHGERRDTAQQGDYVGSIFPYDVQFNGKNVRRWSCMKIDELHDDIQKDCDARHKMLILDSCHSGELFKFRARGDKKAPEVNFRAFKEPVFYALTSARAEQEAKDGKDHSPFAKALLDVLEQPSETWKGGVLTSARLALEVETRISEKQQGENQDALGGPLSGTGQFFFFSKGPPVPPRFDGLLGSMPGLNGRWWFEETPWLVPGVRAELAKNNGTDKFLVSETRSLRSGNLPPLLGANVADLYADLKNQYAQFVDDKGASLPNYYTVLRYLDGAPKGLAEGVETKLQKICRELDDRLKSNPSAFDYHTRAVIHHRLGDAKEANESYQEAIQLYRNSPEAAEFLALCLSDYGRMKLDLARDLLESAARDFHEAGCISKSPYLQFVALCNEAEVFLFLHNSKDAKALLVKAKALAEAQFQADHPLFAYLHERFAWAYFENWKIDRILEELHKAAEIWKKNEKRNPKAAIYGLITQYGLAIALRLQGKREESQRELDRVLSRMEDAINKSDDPAAISDIRAQFAISLEKMAEGLLFDPISRPHPANVYFQSASRYVLDVPKNRQPMLRARIRFKRCIALSRLGGVHVQEARQLLSELDDLKPEQIREFHVLQSIARTEIDLASKRPEAQDELRKILRDALKDSRHIRGDILEILLFTALQLLELDTQSDLAVDFTQLVQIALLALERSRDVLPLLRPYLDKAIGLVFDRTKDVDFWLVEGILIAKTGTRVVRLSTTNPSLVFYFSDKSNPGRAIWWSPEGGAQVFKLDMPLDRLIAREANVKAPLPAALSTLLKRVDGPVLTYWSDAVLGLTDASFPFESGRFGLQLP